MRYLLNVEGTVVRDMHGRDLLVDEAGAWTWRRLSPGGGLSVLQEVPTGSALLGLPSGVGVVDRDGKQVVDTNGNPRYEERHIWYWRYREVPPWTYETLPPIGGGTNAPTDNVEDEVTASNAGGVEE